MTFINSVLAPLYESGVIEYEWEEESGLLLFVINGNVVIFDFDDETRTLNVVAKSNRLGVKNKVYSTLGFVVAEHLNNVLMERSLPGKCMLNVVEADVICFLYGCPIPYMDSESMNVIVEKALDAICVTIPKLNMLVAKAQEGTASLDDILGPSDGNGIYVSLHPILDTFTNCGNEDY